MATGRIILPALAWVPLDGSSGNLAPLLDFVQSSGGPPGPRFARWLFEHTADLSAWIAAAFRMPDDYAGSPALKFDWYSPATGYSPFPFKAALAAVSEDEALETKAPDDGVLAVCYPHDTIANVLNQDAIDLADYDDDLAAGDLVMLVFGRDDTWAGESTDDAYFLGGAFEYTTT